MEETKAPRKPRENKSNFAIMVTTDQGLLKVVADGFKDIRSAEAKMKAMDVKTGEVRIYNLRGVYRMSVVPQKVG